MPKPSATAAPPDTTLIRGAFRRVLLSLLFAALLLFGSAGRWDWTMGWIYLAVQTGVGLVTLALLVRKSPDLILERIQRLKEARWWDKLIVSGAVAGPAAVLVLSGLHQRFDWRLSIPPGMQWGAVPLLIAAYAWIVWAMLENRFFSSVVAIQRDRGHRVISTGPYAWIRHPGYAGWILHALVTPLVLGSIWAFIPLPFILTLILIRTVIEDRTLLRELEGYRDYASRVRYRLLPGCW